MRTIKLYGELGKKFGKLHRFMVKSPAEAVRALCANFPELENYLMTAESRGIGFHVWNGKFQLDNGDQVTDPAAGDIKIIPVVMGANATTRIIVGSVLVIAGAVMTLFPPTAGAAPYVISAGVGLILGGVIELLSPVPKIKEPDERPENRPSYVFNGPVNTTAQGHPVPLGYGRLRVGGGLVSAGVSIDQIMAGFRRVRYDRTVNKNYYYNSDVNREYLMPFVTLPANVFRRELISRSVGAYDPDGSAGPYDILTYKIYYYEIVLEEVPV